MKTSAFIAILLAATTALSAMPISPSENARCRELSERRIDIPLGQVVEHDLLNGDWTFTGKAALKTFQFGDNGQVSVFSKDKKGYWSYEPMKWHVEVTNNIASLVLNGQKMQLLQTCEGIILTDFSTGKTMELAYAPATAAARARLVQDKLVGEWTNVTSFGDEAKCDRAKGAFLSYEFRSNGTYICNYGNQQDVADEKGSWEISRDGQFLLLRSNSGAGIEVVRINTVDDHGLVLDQVMRTSEIGEFFCSDAKSLAFIK